MNASINSVQLNEALTDPSPALLAAGADWDGDILILGAGGKIGPSLAHMAQRVLTALAKPFRVVAASRFTDQALRKDLERAGVETIAVDFLDDTTWRRLPRLPNVFCLAGQKFGTTEFAARTWAMNTYVAGRVAETFKASRIVVYSTGNLYPLTDIRSGGSVETDPPRPLGEYAASCLGRERVMEFFSRTHGTPMVFFRLNYAVALTYGVLTDVALAVYRGEAVDVSMGLVNVLWQGDANDYALRTLTWCQTPPTVVNATGPETISVRWLAEEFGRRFARTPSFGPPPGETALLSNAAELFRRAGYPRVTLGQMIDWTAEWVATGQPLWDRPTHFQQRQGAF